MFLMNQPSVQEHYGQEDLRGRVAQALEYAGMGEGTLNPDQLAPLDQFHVGGLEATDELAEEMRLKPGDWLLDVGSGLGGPARHLAARYGCYVTGIDLSPAYVDLSRMLTERCDLSEGLSFVEGNALELPFPDESFDHAWTIHVAMNIADRDTLYAGIARVLKPGGLFAIYDVVLGSGNPTYPLPWASTPEISFLLSPEAMRESLERAGFEVVLWRDHTDEALAWFAGQQAAMQLAPQKSPLSIGVVMGPGFGTMAANLVQNLKEGRLRLLQAIVRKGL